MNSEELIEKIADENGIPEADVEEVYNEKLEECEEAGLVNDEAEARAMKMVWTAFKRQSMSSSVKIQGMFIGHGERYDAVEYERQNAIDAYQQNPQKAIKQGAVAVAVPPGDEDSIIGNGVQALGEKNGWVIVGVDERTLQYDFAERGTDQIDDGNTKVEGEAGWVIYPLDTREKYNSGDTNDNFRTPLPKHRWRRRATGVFRGEDEDAFIGQMTFSGKSSIEAPTLFEHVEFNANVNDSGDMVYINSTSDTTIQPSEELADDWPDVYGVIDKMFKGTDMYHDLQSLYDFLEEDGTRETIIVKGDVVSLDMEPNSNGTLRMVLGDFQFQGGEMVEQEATVWIPEEHDKYIDFAVDSEVYVLGQARLVDGYDSVKGERTPDEKEVSIGAQGLIADPDMKIPREDNVEELDEEALGLEEDDEGW